MKAMEYKVLKRFVKLKGRKKTANEIGITYSNLTQKLNGFVSFRSGELDRLKLRFPEYNGED